MFFEDKNLHQMCATTNEIRSSLYTNMPSTSTEVSIQHLLRRHQITMQPPYTLWWSLETFQTQIVDTI